MSMMMNTTHPLICTTMTNVYCILHDWTLTHVRGMAIRQFMQRDVNYHWSSVLHRPMQTNWTCCICMFLLYYTSIWAINMQQLFDHEIRQSFCFLPSNLPMYSARPHSKSNFSTYAIVNFTSEQCIFRVYRKTFYQSLCILNFIDVNNYTNKVNYHVTIQLCIWKIYKLAR
jgi:hypothetical protein